MAVYQEGSNVVVDASVAGSVFPASESELAVPILLDGSREPVQIGGAVYSRSLEIRCAVQVNGPIVSRGDTRLNAGAAQIVLLSGLTVNGSLTCDHDGNGRKRSIMDSLQDASVVVKGDLAVNHNIALKNTIVFGSLRAVNCSLENCLVLGTCLVDEHLRVAMSSIGGYASREVTFEGDCVMLNALGESRAMPLFVPYEEPGGGVVGCDMRYYPAMRDGNSIVNRHSRSGVAYPEVSRLFASSDWVEADASPNPALEELTEGAVKKWILSIGGRVSDISKISNAVVSMTRMLKCGFEYEHYHPRRRKARLDEAVKGLTDEERWLLEKVCA